MRSANHVLVPRNTYVLPHIGSTFGCRPQPRWTVQKDQSYKTSGLKKPRVRDDNVVSVNEGENGIASQLVAAITGNQPDADVEPVTVPNTSFADIDSVCQVD